MLVEKAHGIVMMEVERIIYYVNMPRGSHSPTAQCSDDTFLAEPV